MRERNVGHTTVRGKTPLVVRGSLPRVFLSLGIFMEAGLLFCGSYLLADAILQPQEAGTFSVVGGGTFLAFATVLLFYLAWPGKRGMKPRREESVMLPEEVVPAKFDGTQRLRQPNWAADKKAGLLRPM